ncbi:MAG: T9SS type A sorting domain-containing protein [Porphyromonas sp.]|nr:T9SS type A sorting domain-containing protein [Porphyromonas sp.]
MTKLSEILLASCAVFGLLAVPCISHAQQEFRGQPISFAQNQAELSLRSATAASSVVNVPLTVNLEDQRERAAWSMSLNEGFAPLLVGCNIDAGIEFAQAAERIVLPGGKAIYRLHLKSEGAMELAPLYSEFMIPRGAKLYVYDPQRSVVRGAYMYETNPQGGAFSSSSVPGDEIILEYEPNEEGEMPRLTIEKLIYFFRQTMQEQIGKGEDRASAKQININCPLGRQWQDQKAGICQILMVLNGQTFVCSGSLVNNTSGNFEPYILSAAHCASLTDQMTVSKTELAQWQFAFHYEKPKCSNSQFSSSQLTKSMVGCEVLSFIPTVGMSDGLLLKLKSEVPEDYRVYYNGWDRSEPLPKQVTGLHHPMGDVLKISSRAKGGKISRYTWRRGLPTQGGKDAHMTFTYLEGDTEPGSSGSALFNSDKLIVGTLTGASNGYQIYGRFFHHWDQYASKGDYHQLGKLLDPKGNGSATKLEGAYRNDMRPLYPVTKVEAMATKQDNRFLVIWDAPLNEEYARTKYGKTNVVYTLLRNGEPVEGLQIRRHDDASYYVEDDITASDLRDGKVTYAIRVSYTGLPQQQTLVYDSEAVSVMGIRPVASVKPSSVELVDGHTRIKWSAPAFYQEWTKVDYETEGKPLEYRAIPLKHIPLQEGQPEEQENAIYVEKWMMGYLPEMADGQTLNPLYIKQVNFVPTEATDQLSLFLSYHYSLLPFSPNVFDPLRLTQKMLIPQEAVGRWHSVPLKRPIRLDPMQTMMVGFSTPNRSSSLSTVNQVVGSGGDEIAQFNAPKALCTGIEEYGKPRPKETFGKDFVSETDYFALRLIVSSDPSPLKEPVTDVQYKGKLLSAPPIVREYVVKKDGVELSRLNPNRYSYTDESNATGKGNYEIEVIYQDPYQKLSVEAIDLSGRPSVYPSVFDQTLRIRNAEASVSVELFAMDGSCLRRWADVQPDTSLDVSDLSRGSYVVVVATTNGRYHQKVLKR